MGMTGNSKSRVSEIIFLSSNSGILPSRKGAIASYAISGIDFDSIFSKNESGNRCIFSGKYNPLSGAIPRTTASSNLAGSDLLFKLL